MHRALAWDDLLYVLAVGRAGSLAGAARALKVNHSTVFRRIGQIEERLGVRLFDRRRDGYGPTPAGEAAVALAASLDEEVNALERRLSGEDLRPSGTVRVTTTDTLISTLVPICARFRGAYPEIELELATGNEFLNLSRRDADVALRPSSKPPEELHGRRVASIAFAIHANPVYRAKRGLSLDPADHDWVGLDDSLSHLSVHKWLRDNVPPERIRFRATSFLAVMRGVQAGMGFGLLPCYLPEANREVLRVTDPMPELATDLWLLVHEDLRRTARVRAFADYLWKELADLRPQIECTRA